MEKPQPKLHEVKLRDIQSLLSDVTVVSYSTKPLLPTGENWGSTILKVEAVVKKSPSDEEETLHLVAKMLPPTDFQRLCFDSPYTVKKEIFLYEQLLPMYRDLERDLGLNDDELFDAAPKLFGARCSLEPGSTEVDDDAVILMQNLVVEGYYCLDKRKGFDLVHAKIAISTAARFHALGIAMKQHRPDVFENIKHRAKCFKLADVFDMDVPKNFFLRVFREDPVISQHYDFLETALNVDPESLLFDTPPEPWATIVHADYWVNNIMFKDKKDVKLVDFQNFLFLASTRELIFCLMVNLNDEVMERDFDYLLDYYYEKFIETLKRMKCDTSQFTRSSYEERLRIDSVDELHHIPFLLNVMTNEVKEDKGDAAENVFKESSANPLLQHKLRRMVLKYAEKGWTSHQKS